MQNGGRQSQGIGNFELGDGVCRAAKGGTGRKRNRQGSRYARRGRGEGVNAGNTAATMWRPSSSALLDWWSLLLVRVSHRWRTFRCSVGVLFRCASSARLVRAARTRTAELVGRCCSRRRQRSKVRRQPLRVRRAARGTFGRAESRRRHRRREGPSRPVQMWCRPRLCRTAPVSSPFMRSRRMSRAARAARNAPWRPGRRWAPVWPREMRRCPAAPFERMWLSARKRISFDVSCAGLERSSWSFRIDKHSTGTCGTRGIRRPLTRQSRRKNIPPSTRPGARATHERPEQLRSSRPALDLCPLRRGCSD